jgi:radical SAM protein with 4Fe4S-binding SPASM domain
MTLLKNLLKHFASPPSSPLAQAGIDPGLYHYLRESGGTYTRFHLRADATGQGLLLANATAAARLNPSGVIIAKGLLDGATEETILQKLAGSFRGLTPEQARADIAQVRRIITTLDSPGDNYPILNLGDPAFAPKAAPLGKPLSADVPLASSKRLVPLLDRLWEQGIPHVTLLAGERPNAKDLVRAVQRAEDLGMIAGVRARGSDLAQAALPSDLAVAGVDHLDILYLSSDPKIHDALAGAGDHQQAVEMFAQARKIEVCPVANVVLVRSTLPTMVEALTSFRSLGVASAGLVALATTEPGSEALLPDELIHAATWVEHAADQLGVRLLWYPPVEFDPKRSLAEQVRRVPRCSGDTAIRVEPDGSVIPARGPLESAGNLLTDDWDTIARGKVYNQYHQRIAGDTRCVGCPGLALCAADCPRNPAGWAGSSGQWSVVSGQ